MKLEAMGIGGVELQWFRSYLENHSQVVHINSKTSSVKRVQVGAPQEALLGVLLFEIIINDLPKSLKYCSSILYADDTTIYVMGRSLKFLRMKVQADLESLSEWLKLNNLMLNAKKTKSMLFNRGGLSPNFNLVIENESIQNVLSFKFLGIVIDISLSFKSHFDLIYDKMQKASYIICKLSRILPAESLKPLYHALYGSQLTYGMLVWFPMLLKQQQNRLYLLQKHLLRSISLVGYRHHCMPLFKKHSILTVFDRLFVENCKLMYKIETNVVPIPIKNLYQISEHSHNTRCVGVSIIRHKMQIVNRSFLCKPITDWQSLSYNIKNCSSIKSFVNHIKQDRICKY